MPEGCSFTLRDALKQAAASIDKRDAETLLLHLLKQDRAWLRAHPEAQLSAADVRAFESLVARRVRHEPMQYITGHQEFYRLDFRVTPEVLIPRPETEGLVEAVLHWLHRQITSLEKSRVRIADVGTGSGAIAVTLASALPHAVLYALDLSPSALALAALNAQRLGTSDRMVFLESDLLKRMTDAHPGLKLDVVVSNPPYVPLEDFASLQPEVRDHEPHLALFAGADGLSVYRRLIPEAWQLLRPGGLLAMEFGFGQRGALAALLTDWASVEFHDDYAGIPRIVLAERP